MSHDKNTQENDFKTDAKERMREGVKHGLYVGGVFSSPFFLLAFLGSHQFRNVVKNLLGGVGALLFTATVGALIGLLDTVVRWVDDNMDRELKKTIENKVGFFKPQKSEALDCTPLQKGKEKEEQLSFSPSSKN